MKNKKYIIPYWDPRKKSGRKVFFRFYKIIYTAALRFGVAINGHDSEKPLTIKF